MSGKTSSTRPRPLSGIRVVDISTVVMAPWASQMLADMGADVIKVESFSGDLTRQMGPRRHEGMGALFLTINRNKRSVVLNLQRAAGRDALMRLTLGADVLLHNMRPKVAKKLRLTYDDFAATHPQLIYCGAYGFRKEGPLADKPAYDDIIQAASGVADVMGAVTDQPRYVPSIVADKISAYAVATGLLGALFQRSQTGKGQSVEIGMFETLVDFLMVEHLYGATFDPPIDRMGYSRILTKERRPYATLDGYLAVLPYSDQNWRDFFKLAGREELMQDARFATLGQRVVNAKDLYGIVAEIVATRTSAQWIEALEAANIPVTPVNTMESLLDDAQLQASGFWHFIDHPTEGRLRQSDAPVRFSGSDFQIQQAAPTLGQHSEEVLLEAGLSLTEIDALFADGVTSGPRHPSPSGDPACKTP